MCDKLTQIADIIISDSDGSFRIEWGEEYESLTEEEQQKVFQLVYDSIGNCDGCGWNFAFDSLETAPDGGAYCWSCYEDELEEPEE